MVVRTTSMQAISSKSRSYFPLAQYARIALFSLILPIACPLAFAAGDKAETTTLNSTPELFLPVANAQAAPANSSQVGRQSVQFNRALTHLEKGSEVHFSTPRGTRYTIIFDRQVKHSSSNTTWIGSLKDYGNSYRAMVTFGEGGISGRIRTPEGIFLVESNATGEWLIDPQAAGMIPAGLGADDGVAPPSKEDKPSPKESSGSVAHAPAVAANAGSSTIDVMVLYTPGLASRLGSGLSARIDQLVTLANQAYLDSGVQINLRLVHKQQINYSDTTSNGTALDALTNGTGAFTGVVNLRDSYGADLVSLVRPYNQSTAGGCGQGWILGSGGTALSSSYAYSVVGDGNDVGGSLYYCTDLTFTHELGHNMGSAHDRANSSVPGVYLYSYGYGVSGTFGTVMSYINPEIGKFSNPAITCNGLPCGISETASNAANNGLSLNNTRETIANFRASAPPALTGRLVNLSTRGWVGTGDSVMIAGFIVGGNSRKQVLIRAIGPTLVNAGVPSVLNDPMMTLTTVSGSYIAENDDWRDTKEAEIQATGKSPVDNRESAILATLDPGPYTAIVRGVGNTMGNALIEVYEIDAPTVPLINISTRGPVKTGDNIMIAGFIIGGDGPQQVLIRALGPDLANAGVPSVLDDPTMTLTTVQGTPIAENDDWRDTQEAAIRATGKMPNYDRESAILITLEPGPYTAIIRGYNNTTGNALVEVFEQH